MINWESSLIITVYLRRRYVRSRSYIKQLPFCLFGVCDPLENFSLIWRRHHHQWRAANFDLCSALMAIEQWGFFSVPYLLWYGASVYNGHPRGPVTPVAVKTCFNDLGLSRLGFEHLTFRLRGQLSIPLRHRLGHWHFDYLYGYNVPKQDFFNENPYDIAGFWMHYVLSVKIS